MNINAVKTLVLALLYVLASEALVCFNCSSEKQDYNHCAGDFVGSILPFNATRKYLINCTEENSMCFVRSWSSRSRRAWIVQRGCYQSPGDDPLPQSMSVPTRAMTCKHERRPDAEYKVCICQADWCNSAPSVIPFEIQFLPKCFSNVIWFTALYIIHEFL